MIKVITVSNDRSKCNQLEQSLKSNGWDYAILEREWGGFGTKINETYKYLKANPKITHFFFTDGWDSVVCQSQKMAELKISRLEWENSLVISAEKNCWPDMSKISEYPSTPSEWKYVNSGGYFSSSELFCELIENNPVRNDEDDQRYFTNLFLKNQDKVIVDFNCEIFQTIGFCRETDLEISYILKVKNSLTNTFPIFIHGNGHTPMEKYYNL